MPGNQGDWTEDVDLTRPNVARVYDYYLGGSHNFAVDRDFAAKAIALWPDLPRIMQANRAFLRRAVDHCVAAGIRQFIDLGSGIPTVGSVHEVAQAVDPRARVVYVDCEPIAVATSRTLLRDTKNTDVLRADLRNPAELLAAPEITELIDLSEPVAVLMVAVLHFVEDADDPAGIIADYRAAMAPGSHLVISHATGEGRPDEAGEHQDLYRRTPTPMTMRSRAEVRALFDGFDLVDPGVVFIPEWRPDSDARRLDPSRVSGVAAVGRRR